MPLLDVEAMNTSLDNDYDGNDCEVALYVGDPVNGGVEINSTDCPGYTRYASDASERLPADQGKKRICEASYTVSSPWALSPDHYQIFMGGVGWDGAPLNETADVEASGSVLIDVFYDDSVPTS